MRLPGSLHVVLVAAYCAIATAPASAQSSCGPEDTYGADRVFTTFLSSSGAEADVVRANKHLVQQSASAPHGGLQDDKTCKALRKAVRKLLKVSGAKSNDDDEDEVDAKGGTAKADPESTASYSYYRLGDYYGVVYSPPRYGLRIRGPAPVYLFSVSTMQYMGEIHD